MYLRAGRRRRACRSAVGLDALGRLLEAVGLVLGGERLVLLGEGLGLLVEGLHAVALGLLLDDVLDRVRGPGVALLALRLGLARAGHGLLAALLGLLLALLGALGGLGADLARGLR